MPVPDDHHIQPRRYNIFNEDCAFHLSTIEDYPTTHQRFHIIIMAVKKGQNQATCFHASPESEADDIISSSFNAQVPKAPKLLLFSRTTSNYTQRPQFQLNSNPIDPLPNPSLKQPSRWQQNKTATKANSA